MFQQKLFWVLGAGQLQPVLAIRMMGALETSDEESRADVQARIWSDRHPGRHNIILVRLSDTKSQFYADRWEDDFMRVAHAHICGHYDELKYGAVIDTEHILHRRPEPYRTFKEASESLTRVVREHNV